MRKTPKNRNTEFPPSAAAAERLADYKGEGQNPLDKMINRLLLLYLVTYCYFVFPGVANLTSPESDIYPFLSVNEMPEVNEGNPAPSSSSSSKDNKASDNIF